MKSVKRFFGGITLMFLFNLLGANNYNDMQKLMAEKSFKMPNENNPIMTHKFGADPAVLVYEDTVYVYSTNDMQQLNYTKGKQPNGYNKITSLNVFCSKDLVNWTDCGVVDIAGKNGGKGDAKWASNSWAPAIACKKVDGKDKFFLYFADSGNGIGVVVADSPVGPFVDPIKKPLISRQTPTCAEVNWLFDPAVFVDSDGKGYIYFGGGHDEDKYEHPKTARCVALKDNMIEIDGVPQVMDPPFLFEDSGINKIGDTYYYTYCTNWMDRSKSTDKDKMPIAVIGYMTSKNPLGPFEYKGYTLENPATYFGASGNNHHWIFEFKNKWYIAYHTQTLEKTVGLEKGGYRALFIDNFNVNADGSLPIQKGTKEGVAQVCNFDASVDVPAATFASCRNVVVTDSQTLCPVKNGAYICVKGVDFSKGAKEIEFTFAKAVKRGFKSSDSIKIMIDSFGGNGTVIGEAKLNKKLTLNCKLDSSKLSESVHDLYFVFSGDCELKTWKIK